MKVSPIWLAVPAFAFTAASCKKEAAPAPVSGQPVEQPAAPGVKPEEKPAVVPGLSAEARAAKFGIVKHLPKDTEAFISIYNGAKTAERFKASKLWSVIESLDEEAGGLLPGEAEDGESGPGALLGREFFVAGGKGSGDQLANFIQLSRKLNYHRMKSLAGALVAASKEGADPEAAGTNMAMSMVEAMSNLAKDPQGGIAALEKFQMPPFYVGFKVSAEKSAEVEQQISALVANVGALEEMVEPVEFEKGGGKFAGFRILGEKIAASMAEQREDIDQTLGKESADRMLAALPKKNLVIASGKFGEYVVLFLGSSQDDFQLVTDVKESIAANDALSYVDAYADKDVSLLSFGDKPMLETALAASGGLGDLAKGFRDGLAGAEGAGNTRDLEALLQTVVDREQALLKLGSADAAGAVAFFEDGLKLETFGGTDSGAIDWKTPLKLSDLGDSGEVAVFLNTSVEATYDAKAREYVESIVETAYALAKKYSEMPMGDDSDLKSFQDGLKMFDEKFRTDVVAIFDAFRGDFSQGLGHERALVIDLKGGLPTVPGMPQVLAEKGRAPRISWISPVVDRAKIQSSWGKINASTTNLLKQMSELSGSEIPMQKPMSSERNGFTTWFFSMPFINDDFVPSVTLDDKWFIASTSKVQALDLAASATKSSGGANGLILTVKFDPIRRFSQEWLKLVDENIKELTDGDEDKLTEFQANKEKITKTLRALEDLDSLTATARRENGRLRSSVHFKTH